MKSTQSDFQHVASLYGPIALAVFVIVIGTILFIVVRFRRRDDELPRQRTGWPLGEAIYVLLVAAIVALLLETTFTTEANEDKVQADPGLRVQVTAFQWGWRFTYVGQRVSVLGDNTQPPILGVPTNTTVQFTGTSLDVIHSFWVPALRFKRDLFPKRETSFDLTFDRPGLNLGECAEFCGLHHADMTFNVLSLTPRDFASWLSDRRRPRVPGGRRR